MGILYLSKVWMYKFHYDYILIFKKCGKNSRLLFTGTNSLIYEIKAIDLYVKTKKCLILVGIQLSQNNMMTQKN